MTKEELIDKYMRESADIVEQALGHARRIVSQQFGPCGNGEVVAHVAQLIMDNIPFIMSFDEESVIDTVAGEETALETKEAATETGAVATGALTPTGAGETKETAPETVSGGATATTDEVRQKVATKETAAKVD